MTTRPPPDNEIRRLGLTREFVDELRRLAEAAPTKQLADELRYLAEEDEDA
jgi:hypothetical protein